MQVSTDKEDFKHEYSQHYTCKTNKYGLPFSPPLGYNLEKQVDRVQEQRKASLIICDGALGEGKTTLAVQMADYIKKYWSGDPTAEIDFEKQLAMGGDEFQEKLTICHENDLHVLVYDEAGDFNSKKALTKFNRRLNRTFETYRAFRVLVILSLPNFNSVDKDLFDKQIPRMLLHCFGKKQGKYSRYRAFSLKKMFYMKYKMKHMKLPAAVYFNELPNFRGQFYDLRKERSEKLDELGTQNKLDIVNDNVLKNRGLVDYDTISKKLNRSKSWCRRKLNEMDIEAQTTYKRKKYFEDGVIELLESKKG